MARRLRSAWLLCSVIAVANCDSPVTPSELRGLARAEARWADRGFTDYSIETRILCFCPPDLNEWSRIDVVNGHIVRVVILERPGEIPPADFGAWYTVAELFALIRSVPQSTILGSAEAHYDPQWGFPVFVEFKPKEGVADAGGIYEMRNLQPLP